MKTARSAPLVLLLALGAGLLAAPPVPAAESSSTAGAAAARERRLTADEPLFESTVLATSGQGAHTYRIPALDTLPDGTLVAAYDRRNDSSADLPGNLDVMVRRSTDNGRTWTAPQAIADYDDGIGAGDPSVVVDRVTGRVFVFYAYGPQGIGFFNSGTGNANDATDSLHADYAYSDDGGVTWRTRRITHDIKDPAWKGMFASSGTGIQLSTGRLVQQYAFRKADSSIWAASAYSDDHGTTWKMGTPVGPLMDENKTVELADGRVMLNSRTSSARTRLVAYSTDGGITYSAPVPDDELIDPTNNAAILRYDATAGAERPESHWLLFSNTASTTTRHRLTVKLSCNDGLTWPTSKVVEAGGSAYSTLTRLADGTFGLLYESGPYQRITFARFNASWLGVDCPIDQGYPKLAAQTAVLDGLLTAGSPNTVEVRVTNHGHLASLPGTATLGVPAGWPGAAAQQIPAIAPGATAAVRFPVTPPTGTATGEQDFTVALQSGAATTSTTTRLLVVGGSMALDRALAKDFDGTTSYTDLTASLPDVAPLTRGVLTVRFRTTRAPVAGTLLSASDTTAASTNVTLSLNSGVPHFEARVGGVYSARLDGTRSLADGLDHTLAVAVTDSGTTLYADGVRIASTTTPSLFGQTPGLNGLWAGRNVDNGGPQWLYNGRIERITVHRAN
ncbi:MULTISPECIES: exo-alpha-sialidase [unclassified Streptomyces]|uniref:exo-alpha-sialidase n=1 Tax=unclassified Streptomyces TaxID=2593676 RepID=UPI00296627A2|nr:exo-alpha-sialidase [Streptomyces sp. SJL17-1]